MPKHPDPRTDPTSLGSLLKRVFGLKELHIQEALAESKRTGQRIGESLVALGHLSAIQLELAIRHQRVTRSKNPHGETLALMDRANKSFADVDWHKLTSLTDQVLGGTK